MYSSNKIVLQILSLLKANNISKLVVSPGSRHYSLTHSLEQDKYFQLYSVVDERSAAFFALGLIQQYGEPVAVCCTSGSAILNYGPAVSEAFYQHLPLLLLTADRLPQFLNQKEDQMLKQDDVFHSFIKHHVNVPDIKSDLDEWHVNRLLNEAFIELENHGRGPVQINFPILEHHTDTFHTLELPVVRKISWHTADIDENEWSNFSKKLIDKKIMIVWGQSVALSDKLNKALDNFCNAFDTVIVSDLISNVHHVNSIRNTFSVLKALSIKEENDLKPDIVISIGANNLFNGEIKSYFKQNCTDFSSWQVGKENVVFDSYRSLTEVFEMNETTFFNAISKTSSSSKHNYFMQWNEIAKSIEEPNPDFGQLYSIGQLVKSIPQNSILQIANSLTIRMVNLFNIDRSIRCYCNRGVNGIDGCMSTAVGYAANSEQLTFLIIGDLTFFYDMNALWNRHLSKGLRILLINNEGGGVMHIPFSKEDVTLPDFTSAGHNTSARGWVESLGIEYVSATNKQEVEQGVGKLIDKTIETPVLMEVFTKKEEDVEGLKRYFADISRITLKERATRKAKGMVSKFIK